MAPDFGSGWDWLIVLGGGFFLVPLFIPILSSVVAGRLLSGLSPLRALWWGVPVGVLNVPLSWVSFRFGLVTWDPIGYEGWGMWTVCMASSVAVTALFLWWRSRARHRAHVKTTIIA